MGEKSGMPFLSRRLILNSVVVVLFIFAMTGAIYWLSSGDPEKRLGRARMLEELREEQREDADAAGGVGYEVTPLVDGDYFRHLLEDMARARRSIEVLMFEIKLGKSAENPANRLVDGLISARERGVAVAVRLEQSDRDPSLTRINRRTADVLKPHGIYADFDLPDVETHAKAVLIDSRILYVGNHNWSEAALSENKEISLRVESPKSISAMRRPFDRFDRSMQKARRGVTASFFSAIPAWAARGVANVVFLANEEYLPVLLESLRDARQSIYIEVYLIRSGTSEGHPVNRIVSALAAARKRGVPVRVLMDRHFEEDNEKAAAAFKAAGVWDVQFDEEGVINHTKMVIVDDETLIVGSQNWTLSALAASNESAVYVRSREVVSELTEKLNRAP